MKLSEKEILYIINEAKMLLTEDQESDSIKKAIALYMDRMGCDKKTAEKFVRIDLREDLPNLRYKKPGKFILGVTRMFLDGQLRQGTTIEALNTTITYVASDAHYNEYDKNLNGLSATDLINRFADAVKADAEADKERLAQQTFTNNDDYEIVRVDTFEDTSQYNQYCYPEDQWCITKYPSMLKSYTNDGIGQFYFCLRKGFENMEPVQGEGCPKDEYGLSMIAVCVDGHGRLKNSTCRWNHSNGGNDNLFTTDEISQLIGRNFYEVFKPNNNLAEKIQELKNRLKAGENIHDIFDRVDDINGDIAAVYSRSFGWNILKYETKEIMSDKWFEYAIRKIKNGFIEVRLNTEIGFFSIKDGKLYNTQEALQIITNKIEQLLQNGVDDETLRNEIDFDRFYRSAVYDYIEVSCFGFSNIIENSQLRFKQWFDSLYKVTIFDKDLKSEKYYRVSDGRNKKYRIINENGENVLGVEYKWMGSLISRYGTIRVTGDDGKYNIISVHNPKEYLCKRSFEEDLDIAFVREGEFIFAGKDDKGYILCDKNGKDLLGIYLDDIKTHYSDFIIYCKKDGKTAILFIDDLTLTEWYDEIEIKTITDYNQCTTVRQNDKVTIINCIEKKLSPHWVDEIYNIYWTVYKVREGNLFNLIDEKNGELLTEEWFTDISFWEKDKCICIVTNKQNKQNILQYSYSNPLENEYILKNWYDKVEYLGSGSIRIENNGEQRTYTNWEYYTNNI